MRGLNLESKKNESFSKKDKTSLLPCFLISLHSGSLFSVSGGLSYHIDCEPHQLFECFLIVVIFIIIVSWLFLVNTFDFHTTYDYTSTYFIYFMLLMVTQTSKHH